MADSRGPRNEVRNDPSMKEKAEGSRDNVNVEDTEREGGISNRPIEEEQREQQNLPPRGRDKEDSRA
jgi:hypothetical protein